MIIKYTRIAIRELEKIADYISIYNPEFARKIGSYIRLKIDRLAHVPLSAPMTSHPGIRMMPVVRNPFLIFYPVGDDIVVMRRIRHAARRRPGK